MITLKKDILLGHLPLASSGVLVDRPCWVHSLLFTGSTGNNAEIGLLDGVEVNAPIKYKLLFNYDRAPQIIFRYPVLFMRGIYITKSLTTVNVYVQYRLA